MEFKVTAYVNVGDGNFFGLQPSHPIAEVGSFAVKAIDPMHAAEGMFVIGNRMGCDLRGETWPSDVRSVSVGDLLKVVTPTCFEHPRGKITFYTCASVGWQEIPEPTNPIVPLAGTKATSRSAS
jgi:hypothetical protein